MPVVGRSLTPQVPRVWDVVGSAAPLSAQLSGDRKSAAERQLVGAFPDIAATKVKVEGDRG